MTAIHPHSPVETLQRRILGAVIEPGTPGWDEATQAFNTHFVQTPALVAIPANEHDVVAIVELRPRTRPPGRAAAHRPQRRAVRLSSTTYPAARPTSLRGVEIDAERRRRPRRAPASKWDEVVPNASELGLAALHGSTPDVSVAGYSLGGGLGWYARKLGLATNSVPAIELVTADGRLRRVDHEHDPELFWALRGGGGNFGVVTAIEFQLYAIPEVYAGVLFFPWERSAEVLHAWLEWTRDRSRRGDLGRPDPPVPAAARGAGAAARPAFAVVEAVFLGDEAAGARAARAAPRARPGDGHLRDGAARRARGAAHGPAATRCRTSARAACSAALPAQAIDAFVAAAGPGSGSPLVSAEIRHLGGALFRAQRAARRAGHVRRRVPHLRRRPRPRRGVWKAHRDIAAARATR